MVLQNLVHLPYDTANSLEDLEAPLHDHRLRQSPCLLALSSQGARWGTKKLAESLMWHPLYMLLGLSFLPPFSWVSQS